MTLALYLYLYFPGALTRGGLYFAAFCAKSYLKIEDDRLMKVIEVPVEITACLDYFINMKINCNACQLHSFVRFFLFLFQPL